MTESKTQVHVSLVVPAYNEETRIPASLNQIFTFFASQPYTWELIVVDDGSQDATAALVLEAARSAGWPVNLVRNKTNRGKGFSVKRGVLAAAGENIFFTDADLSTPIDEISACLGLLKKVDMVVGSRALSKSNITLHQPLHRETMGRVFNALTQAMVIRGIKDTQCGFKGFTRNVAREAFKRTRLTGFGFDVEVLYIVNKLGYSVLEVPITWHNSASSRVSPVKDGLGMLGDLARIRLNDARGYYE